MRVRGRRWRINGEQGSEAQPGRPGSAMVRDRDPQQNLLLVDCYSGDVVGSFTVTFLRVAVHNILLGYPFNRSCPAPLFSTAGWLEAAPSSAGARAHAAVLAGLSEVDG